MDTRVGYPRTRCGYLATRASRRVDVASYRTSPRRARCSSATSNGSAARRRAQRPWWCTSRRCHQRRRHVTAPTARHGDVGARDARPAPRSRRRDGSAATATWWATAGSARWTAPGASPMHAGAREVGGGERLGRAAVGAAAVVDPVHGLTHDDAADLGVAEPRAFAPPGHDARDPRPRVCLRPRRRTGTSPSAACRSPRGRPRSRGSGARSRALHEVGEPSWCSL